MKRSKLLFYLFLLPSLLTFVFVIIVSFAVGIGYSFTDWSSRINAPLHFIGLKNYITALSDPQFYKSFWFTTKFTAVSIVLLNLFGFSLAILVTRGLKISNPLRTTFFAPNLVGGLILGFIWQFIFTEAFEGIADFTKIDFFKGWLADQNTGFWGLVILTSWQFSGYIMIIYIANIEGIPAEIMEAIDLDGANFFQKVKYVIFPMVAPAFTISVFLTLSNSFKLYDQNFSLTGGGPGNSTQMIAMNILKMQSANKLGEGQAKGVIFFIVVAIISAIQIKVSKEKELEA